MVPIESHREHSRLYYILEADKQAHPMPSERVERLREKILKNFQEYKTKRSSGSPLLT